jgi:g-D-glutamyl-meso-diaminopimelate peptidase
MPIVTTDIPITSARNEALIQELARVYPQVRTEIVGLSAFGRPIRAMVIGNGPRKVLFTAAHHANEWITAYLLLKFAEELAQAIDDDGRIYGVPARTIDRYSTVYLIPLVNPDGVDLVTGALDENSPEYVLARRLGENYPQIPFPEGWKANALGVDLNLQYPAGWLQARDIKFSQGYTLPGPRDFVGRAPLTQPESRALADYTEAVDPAMVLAYHTQGQVIYWKFRDVFVPGAQALGEEFARLSGYRLADTPYESAWAGYKDWFIQEFRRPGYTIEVGLGENPLPLSQFDEIYRQNIGILTTAATGIPQ